MLMVETRDELLINLSPLGPVHTIDAVTAVFTTVVFSVAVQVRLIEEPSVTGVEEGVTVRLTCGGATNTRQLK